MMITFRLIRIYQARNAARMPNAPPARSNGMFGSPAWRSAAVGVRYAMPRNKNARSRVKKSRKKATVDLRVQRSRMKVKMNQPWATCQLLHVQSSWNSTFLPSDRDQMSSKMARVNQLPESR